MGTPAVIAIKQGDRITWSWLNCDGHMHVAGRKLVENYNDAELASALIALGDLSVLEKSIECPEGHSFSTPVAGYTIAYKRDRGKTDVDPQTSNMSMFLHCNKNNICYVFEGDAWFTIRNTTLVNRLQIPFEQRYHFVRVGEVLAGTVE